jgi:hypothetical protein
MGAGSATSEALTVMRATDERVAESLGRESKKEGIGGNPAPPNV